MDCRSTREQLGLLVDGELPFALSRAVLRHLEDCAACQRELELLRSIGSGVRSLGAHAPVGLRARIVAEAMALPAADEARVFSFAYAWPRAAAMLVGAASVMFLLRPLTAVPAETASRAGHVASESRLGLELAGSFLPDLRALTSRPEGRLMFEIAEAGR